MDRSDNTSKAGVSRGNFSISLDRRISVAPMMDYTDRHFRYLLRLLNPSALLYTEMITSQALVHADPRRWLAFSEAEHPVALQLGGNDPTQLAAAARMGVEFGYDEINLNCGCPSDRVQNGRFGACLMADPERIEDCIRAMREVVSVPVTVKCRIGIEPRSADLHDEEFLSRFVRGAAAAGCNVFIIHARNAVLTGLSPKENREIPPLRYDVVRRLKDAFPDCTFVLNGGIRTIAEVEQHLKVFAGVMLGREICQNPYLLAELHQQVVDPRWQLPDRELVIEQFADYAAQQLATGESLRSVLRHVLGLYAGRPGARAWRRFISERLADPAPNVEILRDAARLVRMQASAAAA